MNKIYPSVVLEEVHQELPEEIIITIDKYAWNVFGIYELVQKKLKEYKKRQKINV